MRLMLDVLVAGDRIVIGPPSEAAVSAKSFHHRQAEDHFQQYFAERTSFPEY
jgi:hypothetical protein